MKFLWLVLSIAAIVVVPKLVSGKKAFLGSRGRVYRRCGGIRTGTSGYITSLNYPRNYRNNMLCIYKIRVPARNVVELSFLDFNLEYHRTCNYDYLWIRNGFFSSSPSLGKFCGSRKPSTMLTKGNTAYIKFRTDRSVTKRGFKLWWRAIPRYTARCPNTRRALGLRGVLTTPHYPRNYGNNQYCYWKITAPAGHHVRFTIRDFNLEKSVGCKWDYVELRDGWGPYITRIGRYCGTRKPGPIRTRSNTLHVIFKSDGSVTRKGMRATYTTGY